MKELIVKIWKKNQIGGLWGLKADTSILWHILVITFLQTLHGNCWNPQTFNENYIIYINCFLVHIMFLTTSPNMGTLFRLLCEAKRTQNEESFQWGWIGFIYKYCNYNRHMTNRKPFHPHPLCILCGYLLVQSRFTSTQKKIEVDPVLHPSSNIHCITIQAEFDVDCIQVLIFGWIRFSQSFH